MIQIGQKRGVKFNRLIIFQSKLYMAKKEFERANELLSRAINDPDTDPWAFFYIGKLYTRMGRIEDAIDKLYDGIRYCESKRIRSTNIINAMQEKLAKALIFNGEYDAALRILDAAKASDPNNLEINATYLLARARKEGIDKLEDGFNEFRRRKPEKRRELADYYIYCAQFLEILERYEEANENYRNALKYDNTNIYIMTQYAKSLLKLALAARDEGKTDIATARARESARVLRRVFQFDPDNIFAQNLQEDLYREFLIQLTDII